MENAGQCTESAVRRGGVVRRRGRRPALKRLAVTALAATLFTVTFEAGMILGPSFWGFATPAESDDVVGFIQPVEIAVTMPQIDFLKVWDDEAWDLAAVEAVNEAIRERALAMILDLVPIGTIDGGFETHLDRPDVLSVTMHYAAYLPPMAHPAHLRASVTADPRTGRIYSLPDLFADEAYVDVLSEAVARQIEAEELPLLVEFERISPDQDFYLTESHLVLYFQLYELVPYAWGFPEFAIPLASLKNIAKEDGPIAALLGAR